RRGYVGRAPRPHGGALPGRRVRAARAGRGRGGRHGGRRGRRGGRRGSGRTRHRAACPVSVDDVRGRPRTGGGEGPPGRAPRGGGALWTLFAYEMRMLLRDRRT